MGYAVVFLRIAALFQLVDGLQVIGIASLRGLRDTAVPMWLAGFGYWVVGFPICWLLGFHTQLGGAGIWIGLALRAGDGGRHHGGAVRPADEVPCRPPAAHEDGHSPLD